MSAVNIRKSTIHSGLRIKPGAKLLGLNDKSKAASRGWLSEVTFLIAVYKYMINIWSSIWFGDIETF